MSQLLDRQYRKLENAKESGIRTINHDISKRNILDGEIVISKSKNKPLKLSKKLDGQLWNINFSNDGNQIVDGNINLNNKLIIKNYPAFSAYQSTSVDETALATATWTRIPLDTENYDNGSNFDTGNFKFTAPYHGDAKILLDSDADTDAGDFDAEERLDVALFKNQGDATTTSSAKRMASSLHLVAASISAAVWEGRLSTDLELSTGDFIELYAWQNSGVEQHTYSNAVDDWTRFTGHLVCAL